MERLIMSFVWSFWSFSRELRETENNFTCRKTPKRQTNKQRTEEKGIGMDTSESVQDLADT